MGKVAGQRVTFRASARIGAIAASLAAAAALLLPTAALAGTPTEIGSAQGDTPCNLLTGPFDSFQLSSQGVSYAVPSGGTSITSWSVQAYSGDTGPVALEVWNPAPVYTLVGMSALQPLAAGINTFDLTSTPITVQAGDLIGLRVEGPLTCMQSTPNFADKIWFDFQAIGITVLPFVQLNVAATVDVTVTPPPPPPTPTSADQCKDGGWQGLTDNNGTPFKNQGDCVSFVATDGTNAAGAPPADATNAGNGPPADATNAGKRPPADATNAGNGPPA